MERSILKISEKNKSFIFYKNEKNLLYLEVLTKEEFLGLDCNFKEYKTTKLKDSILITIIPNETFIYRISRIILSKSNIDLEFSLRISVVNRNEVIEIKTVKDFLNITTTGHYKVCNDLDLKGIEHKGFSNFTGTIEGNHKVISNLTVKVNVNSDSQSFSLFNVLDGAVIQNLKINLNIDVENKFGFSYSASLLAYESFAATLYNVAIVSSSKYNLIDYISETTII
jgi:hypothetical protein